MSLQAILGLGPKCYNCLYNWLVTEEDTAGLGLGLNPYNVFCFYGFVTSNLLSFTGCGNNTDCGISDIALYYNLESICASSTSASFTTSTTSSSVAPSTASTPISISISTTPTSQTFQSTTHPQSTPTSTTTPLSTSQAPVTTTNPPTTPSTAPSTTPSTTSFISIPTKSAQAPTSTLARSLTISLSSTVSISAADITSSTLTYSPLPAYTGSGNLLRGYCTTPFFTLIPGPTADFYIGVVGCVNGKDDCCPFSVASTHATTIATTTATTTAEPTAGTVTTESFVTITLGATSPTFISTSGTIADIGQNLAFPTPNQGFEATLNHCPGDYQTISSVCCPSEYLLWTTMLGGETPCYSTVSNFLTPPPLPIPTTTLTIPPLPTSTIINVIYAMAYPIKPSSSNLTLDAKAGVGAGTGVFAIVMFFVVIVYFLRRRDRKNSSPVNSTRVQSTTDTATQEWWNSRASELHHTSLPSPQPIASDRDGNIMRTPSPPSEPSSGNANFYHPAMEQHAIRRVPVPVPVPVSMESPAQGANYPLPPRPEMDSYYASANFGLPPGELHGGHINQRQELQDRNWNP